MQSEKQKKIATKTVVQSFTHILSAVRSFT